MNQKQYIENIMWQKIKIYNYILIKISHKKV